MDDDDTEEKRESVTLVNKLSHKETKTKLLVSSSRLVSMSSKLETKQRNSTESSDTMECASENEVENIPKDEEASEPVVTDEKGNKISGGDRLEEGETLVTSSRQHTVTKTTSLKVCEEEARQARFPGIRLGFFHRSPQSSSSQEDYEPEVKSLSKLEKQQPQQSQQHLLTARGSSSQTAKSMESLRTSRNFLSADERYVDDSKSLESLSESHVATSKSHYRSFLTSSSRDVRRIVTVESKSSDNLHREESLNAEVRRGLFANTGLERKIPQNLSLPPPSNVFSLTSPGGSDRKITILSPHSPLQTTEFQFSQTLKTRRKKAIVLPRLVLPRSESDVFFSEWVVGQHVARVATDTSVCSCALGRVCA